MSETEPLPRGRTAIRGSAVTLAGQLVRFGVQIAALIVLARLLNPQDFGLVAMVTAITGIAFILGDAGLSLAALQARELSPAQRSNLFWLNTAIGVALGLLVFALAEPIAAFYGEPALVPITRAIAVIFPISGLSAQFRAHVTRDLRFSVVARVDVAAQVGALGVAVVAAMAGGGYWAIVAQQVTAASVALLSFAALARWRPSLPSRGSGMRSLVTFGANTMGVQLLNYASVNVPSVLLGFVAGPTVLGFYNRAHALFTMPMSQLAAPITRVVIPVLSTATSQQQKQAFLERGQLIISYSLVGLFVLLAALADPLVVVILGQDWQPAVAILRVLAIGGAFQALAYVYYWAFVSEARTGVQLALMLPSRLAMIGFAFVGVQWGAVGVAWAVTAGLVLIWIVNSTLGMRLIGIDSVPLLAASVRPVLMYVLIAAGVVGGDLLWFTSWDDLPRLAAQLAVAVALGGAAMAVPAWRRDVRSIVSALASAARKQPAEQ